MREQIGDVAGRVWETLGQKGEISIAMLPKLLKEKSDMVYQALGWLAREDKISYNTKGAKRLVSLTDSEFGVYKTVH